jgi:hypothetical protein
MIRVEFPLDPVVSRWLAGVQEAARPGSRVQNAVRGDIARIVRADHERKMLTNITKYGQTRAPLSPRTLANPKRGPGPSLIPNLRNSRYLTTYMQQWDVMEGRSVLRMWFQNFVSRSGFPIPLAHEHGVPRKRLPSRPVMGITPEGLREIGRRLNLFANEVARGH